MSTTKWAVARAWLASTSPGCSVESAPATGTFLHGCWKLSRNLAPDSTFRAAGPGRQGRRPSSRGNAERLEEAVRYARESGSNTERDLAQFIGRTLANEPHGKIVGPTKERAETNGLIVHRGFIVAEWGDTRAVDMTFSVTKSYLSTTVGLLCKQGVIDSVDDVVHTYVPGRLFDTEREWRITWNHLLRQTSDWRGELFSKHDWADRPPRGATLEEMQSLPEQEPGAAWEYNDVRVNLLALCALHVAREPLPTLLRREVMDKIGASRTWRWHGYTTSWIELDGQHVQSVSGGGHWGGGMFVSTRDQARFGYLILREGCWDGERLLSRQFLREARRATPARESYGYMNWFRNANITRRGITRRVWPAAPASAVTFQGAGSNLVYLDWEHDLLIVLRWVQGGRLNGIVERVLRAMSGE